MRFGSPAFRRGGALGSWRASTDTTRSQCITRFQLASPKQVLSDVAGLRDRARGCPRDSAFIVPGATIFSRFGQEAAARLECRYVTGPAIGLLQPGSELGKHWATCRG